MGCFALTALSPLWFWPAGMLAALWVVGLVDYAQPRQAIRRNYPVLAHFRFFFEYIRPEIRQYFMEAETDHMPFSRAQRSIIYQRAKQAQETRPFGSELAMYGDNYEWINHSILPARIDSHDFRVGVGGPACRKS